MRGSIQRLPSPNEAALSLLELLVYLALASLILWTSLPSAYQPGNQRRLKAEADRLVQSIEAAILEGRQNETEIKLKLEHDSYSFSAALSTQLSSHFTHLPNGISVKNAPETILIYRSGATSPSTITLNGYGLNCDIIISLRGRVRSSC